jgi:hypothetical protein
VTERGRARPPDEHAPARLHPQRDEGIPLLIEDVRQRTILPLGRRGKARAWLEDERSLAHQLGRVGREAGARNQL